MTPIYPFSSPIIMTPEIFSLYGGKGTGTFSVDQLNLCFQIAEQQTVNYIGTFLLPTIVTGTYVSVPTTIQRIATDYGYVSRILRVMVKTQKVTQSGGCELIDNKGCAFIYQDTYGYLDVHQLQSICGCGQSSDPYLYEITYEAGLPTGTANLPSMLAAMTIIATITLNELFPGIVGQNESAGDAGIQEWESFGYHERRTAHSLRRTSFGGSAMSTKAAQLIDSCIKKCRKSLRIS
jgi:hypothetical protein